MLALGGFVVAWWVVVVAMTEDGYPGLERFYLPAAAVICVLSGLGLVRTAALASELLGSRSLAAARSWVAIAVGVVLLAGSYHFMSHRITLVRQQEPLAAAAVTRFNELGDAVAAVGGRGAVLPCSASLVTINHSMQPMLAWQLHTTLERVKSVIRTPGLAFVGPWDSIDGAPPPIPKDLSVHRLIATVRSWRIYQVYPPGPLPRCVGH